jgi:hypothetical protein
MAGKNQPPRRKRATNPSDDRLLSAQVVLRGAGGKRPHGGAVITAENVHEYAPPPEAAAAVRRLLTEAGFDLGPVVGNSFSVTAPASVFRQVFRIELREDDRGVRTAGGKYELPRRGLPPPLSNWVEAVTFSPPPDFGPTNFSA